MKIPMCAFTMHSLSNERALGYEMNIILGLMDLFRACEKCHSFCPMLVLRLPIRLGCATEE